MKAKAAFNFLILCRQLLSLERYCRKKSDEVRSISELSAFYGINLRFQLCHDLLKWLKMVFHNEKIRDNCDRYWSRPLSFLQIFCSKSNWWIGGQVVNQLAGLINHMTGHYWQRAERRVLWLVIFRRRRAAGGDRQLLGLGRLGQGGRVEREGEVDLEQKDTSYGFPPVDSAATKKYRIFSCLALILAHAQHT